MLALRSGTQEAGQWQHEKRNIKTDLKKMFGKDFKTPDELFEAVGKQVRTMPQIIIDDKHIYLEIFLENIYPTLKTFYISMEPA